MLRTAAVVAACALAACGPKAAATATVLDHRDDPDAPKRSPYIVTESPGVALTATDATYLYWIDDAGLKRRPHGGEDAKVELVTEKFTADFGALLVLGATAYHFHEYAVTSVALDQKHADPVTIATLQTTIDAFTVAPDGGVFVATAGQILEVAGGKDARLVADGLGTIQDIYADADAVYFAASTEVAAGAPPPTYNPYYTPPVVQTPTGKIGKVPQAGGDVTFLADEQPQPGTLGLHGGRVYWVQHEGPHAVSSVSVDGGAVQVEAFGRAYTLAVDDGGLVYRQQQGAVLEKRRDALQLAFVPDGTWSVDYSGQIKLSPDWIYLTATRSMNGTPAILALPRQIQAIQVPFAMNRRPFLLAVDDDAIYWTEESRESDGVYHIMRGDLVDRGRKELAEFSETSMTELAVGGGQLYFHDGYTISQVSTKGGEVRTFDRVDSWVTGLNVHRNHVYWADGSSIFARKRKGGATITIARNDQYYGYYGYGGYGDGGGDLVFDDDYLYTTGFGQGGVGLFQISERGRMKVLWTSNGSSSLGDDLVLLGDELFYVTGLGSGSIVVMKTTLDGDTTQFYQGRGDSYSVRLVEGAGLLYLHQNVGEFYELTRIDPATGEGQHVFRTYASGYPIVEANDRGVYVVNDAYDAIFHIPHDAPPVPDVGWVPSSE